jgi:hypothetical protein
MDDHALMMCPECGQTGHGHICHHWDITGARAVRTFPVAALDSPEGARERARNQEATVRALLGEF